MELNERFNLVVLSFLLRNLTSSAELKLLHQLPIKHYQLAQTLSHWPHEPKHGMGFHFSQLSFLTWKYNAHIIDGQIQSYTAERPCRIIGFIANLGVPKSPRKSWSRECKNFTEQTLPLRYAKSDKLCLSRSWLEPSLDFFMARILSIFGFVWIVLRKFGAVLLYQLIQFISWRFLLSFLQIFLCLLLFRTTRSL